MRKRIIYVVLLFFLLNCGNHSTKEESKKQVTISNQSEKKSNSFTNYLSSIFQINTYENERILESGSGFLISENILITRLSFFQTANKATVTSLNGDNTYDVIGFLGIDRINDLILIEINGIHAEPVKLANIIVPIKQKTIYLTKSRNNTLPLHKGTLLSYSTILGNKRYRVSNKLWPAYEGSPMFISNGECIGLAFSEIADYEKQTFVTPSIFITELFNSRYEEAKRLDDLQGNNATISEANSQIKALMIETDEGNIKIRLYNETPQYRDNFVRLVRENYYDSLLIHRVIKGFGIQSGAADTRYATKDDVVGWKGPGYTLPAHFIKGIYHKRGVIGSPRKPDTKNSKLRSDGSQFYIVSGRKYNDFELDGLEKQMDYLFSPEQRNTYKTIGGAPHLDGTYTIFGEVLEGMDVVDRISKVEVKGDFRPIEDIRIQKISILE